MQENRNKEGVLDAKLWRSEAEFVCRDVVAHVRCIRISEKAELRCDERSIHLNLTTLEGDEYCLQLSPKGYRIVDNRHDSANAETENQDSLSGPSYFETIYALLNSVSPQYRDSFAMNLRDKLERLSSSQKLGER